MCCFGLSRVGHLDLRDSIQKPTTMSYGRDAELTNILAGQLRQELESDLILGERIGVLSQANTRKPFENVGHHANADSRISNRAQLGLELGPSSYTHSQCQPGIHPMTGLLR